MSITYYKRDTDSGISTPALDTLVDEFVKIMNEATATSVEVTIAIAKAATECLKWITETDKPGKLDWEGGNYTWELRVITANADLSITEVILRRISSDGSVVRASKSSGAIDVSLGTTGVKTGNIVWDDGTQNPADRETSDRLEIVFKITNAAAHTEESAGIGTNTTDDELVTPLEPVIPPIVETIVAKEFPMLYYAESPQELRSKVSGAVITQVAKDFPEALLKTGKTMELRSKWESG